MQVFEVWSVIPGRVVSVSVEAVIDDWEGFRVLLKDHETGRMLRIAFGSVVAYQNRDEGDLVGGEAARSTGLGQGCFYRVRSSEFEARLKLDSLRQFNDLRHFAIITNVDCIDVLSTEDPVVEQL